MKSTDQPQELTGIVQSFNISPRGLYEGFLIKVGGKIIQVNFESEAGAYLRLHFATGAKITLTAKLKHAGKKGEMEHPVYRLTSFKDKKNNVVDFDSDKPDHATVEGSIKSLNYALHGEVNGAILDNGDFIHTKPAGAKAIGLKTGQKIIVKGEVRFSILGHRIIEAETLNGASLHVKRKLKNA